MSVGTTTLPRSSDAHVPFRATMRRSIERAEFRKAMSRRAAGVSIVTTIDQQGYKLGLTATAVTSVSLEPPLVLVCIDNRSRTIAPLQAGATFIVHFLAAGQAELARQFASPVPDKFAGVAHRMTASGCPQLDGVLASIECIPYHIYSGGDHTIFVGQVVDVQVDDSNASPLLYFAGHYITRIRRNV